MIIQGGIQKDKRQGFAINDSALFIKAIRALFPVYF